MSGGYAHRAPSGRASGRPRVVALGVALLLFAMALPAHAAPPSSWWWRGATDLYTLMGVDLSDAGGPGYVPTGVDALGVGRASVFAMAVGRPSVLATAKRDQLTGDTSVMWSEAPWPGETPGPVRWSSVHGLLVGSVVQDGLAQRPHVVSVPFDDAGPATATQLGPWPAGVGEITALAVLDDGTPLALDGPHATIYRTTSANSLNASTASSASARSSALTRSSPARRCQNA